MSKTSDKSFKCPKCDKKLRGKHGFQRHVRQLHPEEANILLKELPAVGYLQCPACDKQVLGNKNLSRHIKVNHRALHNPEENGSIPSIDQEKLVFKCFRCDKAYDNKTALRSHRRRQHPEDIIRVYRPPAVRQYSCDRPGCEFKQATMKDYLKHMLDIHNDSDPFHCEVCPKRFHSIFSLRRHMLVHLEITLCMCPHCGQGFKRTETLTEHIKRKHENLMDKPLFVCEVCGNSYKDRRMLNNHKDLMHAIVSKNQCKICQRKLSSPAALKKHLTSHSNVRPYKCPVCTKTFKNRPDLIKHEVVHNTMKHVSCKLCNTSISRRDYCRRHLKIKHGIDLNSPMEVKKLDGAEWFSVYFYDAIDKDKKSWLSKSIPEYRIKQDLSASTDPNPFLIPERLLEHRAIRIIRAMNNNKDQQELENISAMKEEREIHGLLKENTDVLNEIDAACLFKMEMESPQKEHKENVTNYVSNSQDGIASDINEASALYNHYLDNKMPSHASGEVILNNSAAVHTEPDNVLNNSGNNSYQVLIDSESAINNEIGNSGNLSNNADQVLINSESVINNDTIYESNFEISGNDLENFGNNTETVENNSDSHETPPGNTGIINFDNNSENNGKNAEGIEDLSDTDDEYYHSSEDQPELGKPEFPKDMVGKNNEELLLECQSGRNMDQNSDIITGNHPSCMASMTIGVSFGDQEMKLEETTIEYSESEEKKEGSKNNEIKLKLENGTMLKREGVETEHENEEVMKQKTRRRRKKRAVKTKALPVQPDDEFEDIEETTKTNKKLEKVQFIQRKVLKFKCTVCSKSYQSRFCLLKHMRQIHQKNSPGRVKFRRQFNCQVEDCDFMDATEMEYMNHMKELHEDVPPFQCVVCLTTFTRYCNFVYHQKQHTADTKKHEELRTFVQSLSFMCPICSKYYKNKQCLLRHMRRVHRRTLTGEVQVKNIKQFNCEMEGCVFKQATQPEFIAHMKNIHNKEPFQCPVCTRYFGRYENLKSHIKLHSDVNDHICPHCGLGFKRADGLTKHINYRHEDTKSHECDVCGKKFKEVTRLKYHKLSAHSDTEPFQCKQCGKNLSSPAALKMHARIHSNERPYKCPDCDKTFRCREGVAKHQVLHTSINHVICRLCKYTLKRKDYCKKHLRIKHKIDIPFERSKAGTESARWFDLYFMSNS